MKLKWIFSLIYGVIASFNMLSYKEFGDWIANLSKYFPPIPNTYS